MGEDEDEVGEEVEEVGEEEEEEEEGEEGEERPLPPGLPNPNLARKSLAGRWMPVGLELRGIENAPGMRPVVASSVGSRTSVFFFFFF